MLSYMYIIIQIDGHAAIQNFSWSVEKYFTREEKFCISKRLCNVLFTI